MITPQLTEQYGHVDLVSVVRAIFNCRACAYAGVRSKPSSDSAVPPSDVAFRNCRRVGFMEPRAKGAHVSTHDGEGERRRPNVSQWPLITDQRLAVAPRRT